MQIVSTASGDYQYEVLGLGVKPLVQEFQERVESVIGDDLLASGMQVYVDESLAASKKDDNLTLLRKFFERLRAANIKLRREKCFFMCKTVQYLGYTITQGKITINPGRVEALLRLGHLQGFKKFVNLAELSVPLNKLVNYFSWDTPQEEAWNNIRSIIKDGKFQLYMFDETLHTVVETDASQFAVGSRPIQIDERGQERLIECYGFALLDNQTRLPTIDREHLGVSECLNHYCPYLQGRRFPVNGN